MSSYDQGGILVKSRTVTKQETFVCLNDTCNMMDRGQNDTYRTNMHEGDPKLDNQSWENFTILKPV